MGFLFGMDVRCFGLGLGVFWCLGCFESEWFGFGVGFGLDLRSRELMCGFCFCWFLCNWLLGGGWVCGFELRFGFE